MGQKYNRSYKLYVDTLNTTLIGPLEVGASKSVLIQPPFTIDFNVTRNNLSSVNNAEITVYNLSSANRTLIHKDAWQTNYYRPIELWAGYDNQVLNPTLAATMSPGQILASATQRQLFPRIFRGNVTRAYSYRTGVDFLTKMICQDAGFAASNSIFGKPFKKGTTKGSAIEALINSM